MSNFLITGGAGFIGSNFIKYLLKVNNQAKIINIDKLTYAGSLTNLESIMENQDHIFIQEDICNKKEINRLFSYYKPDYVINFAAESHVDRSIDASEIFVRTNILGTQVLLQASLDNKVKKFIQISTDEVYGSIEVGLFNEESPLKPNNPYAASKASADLLAQSFYNTYKLPMNITRCTNNYGPHQYYEKLIPFIIKRCFEGKKIPLYGDGKNTRDWIYVNDHCSAIYRILQKGSIGEIYNISANTEKQNIEIVRLIIKKIKEIISPEDQRIININEELIQYVEDRKGHDRRYALDASKLRKSLNWLPRQNFEEGLANTIKWYVENEYGG